MVIGVPRWAGSLIGAAIMTIYFTAGGLLGTAWVNSVQLIVMLVGFLIALPVALASVGGLRRVDRDRRAARMVRRLLLLGGPALGMDVAVSDVSRVHHLAWAYSEIVWRGRASGR